VAYAPRALRKTLKRKTVSEKGVLPDEETTMAEDGNEMPSDLAAIKTLLAELKEAILDENRARTSAGT
jgi:hypothetical protein